jgi:O-methyltransferase
MQSTLNRLFFTWQTGGVHVRGSLSRFHRQRPLRKYLGPGHSFRITLGEAQDIMNLTMDMNPLSLYIELLKKTLINEIYIENEVKLFYMVHCLINRLEIQADYLIDTDLIPEDLNRRVEKAKQIGGTVVLEQQNEHGEWVAAHSARNVLEFPHSMIGRKRMDNIHYCIERILADDIPGDFIETGVWRGGATIFMRGMLAAYGVKDRTVWVADSFEGVPPPTYPEDEGMYFDKAGLPVLAVSIEKVKRLFNRYDLLDNQVKFLQGWFKDTLPNAPIERLSLLRLDGDLYESTMDALNALYDKVSVGGYVIVDDYNAVKSCKVAVEEFRQNRQIEDELITIDVVSVFWRKTR